MLTSREIVSTIEMLQSEHLDLRTVTLGINLMDCVSDDPGRLCDNIRTKIITLARHLVSTCNQISDKYGIPVVNKRISVSPIAIVAAPYDAQKMVTVARTLNDVAAEVNVDFIGGFSALVEKGLARGDRALIEAIPEALARTDRVCAGWPAVDSAA